MVQVPITLSKSSWGQKLLLVFLLISSLRFSQRPAIRGNFDLIVMQLDRIVKIVWRNGALILEINQLVGKEWAQSRIIFETELETQQAELLRVIFPQEMRQIRKF